MAGHGFKDGHEGHGAAFRMGDGTGEVRRVQAADELQVPGAGGSVELQGFWQGVNGITL